MVADRFDRKKIIVLSQAANGAVVAALGVLSATGLVEVWHIYAATFLNATFMSVSNPARRAVISALVPRNHLVNATALNSVVHHLDRVVAPALAGVLIAVFGLPLTYGVNGAAHFIAAGALSFIALGPLPPQPQVSPLRSLLEGLSFVRVQSIILVLLAVDSLTMLFGSYQVLLPMLAGQFEMGAAGYGLLASAPAVGGFAGAAAIMYLGDFPYKGRIISGAMLAYCALLVGIAVAPSFGVAYLVAVGLGLTDSMQASLRNAVVQLITPDHLRGRVSSFQHMLTGGVPALGQGILGATAAAVGAPVALVGAALICGAFNVAMLISRRDLRAQDLGALSQLPMSARASPSSSTT